MLQAPGRTSYEGRAILSRQEPCKALVQLHSRQTPPDASTALVKKIYWNDNCRILLPSSKQSAH